MAASCAERTPGVGQVALLDLTASSVAGEMPRTASCSVALSWLKPRSSRRTRAEHALSARIVGARHQLDQGRFAARELASKAGRRPAPGRLACCRAIGARSRPAHDAAVVLAFEVVAQRRRMFESPPPARAPRPASRMPETSTDNSTSTNGPMATELSSTISSVRRSRRASRSSLRNTVQRLPSWSAPLIPCLPSGMEEKASRHEGLLEVRAAGARHSPATVPSATVRPWPPPPPGRTAAPPPA
jgi:hypothetical protein